MHTRAQDILINIPLSVISALNASFVRSEKIDALFSPKDPNYRLLNIIFSLINMLAMPPEYVYNVKRNTYFGELLHEITGEDEKEGSVSIALDEVKHHRENRLAKRRASAPLASLDDRQFDQIESQLFSPGGKRVPLEIADIENKREIKGSPPVLRNIFTGGAILVMSFPVAVGHLVLFYDATEKMFVEKYGERFFDKNTYGIWPIVFCFSLGFSGATLEWLRGGLELAAGASRPLPMTLFPNSHTKGAWYLPKNIWDNMTIDIGASALVSLGMLAEFALFMNEFEEKIIKKHFLGIDEHLLTLISVSLSMMSASMYLGHEGHMFLKIKQAVQKILADEAPYRIRLIQHDQRFSQHARCEKNTIVLYQEEGSIVGRWRKGNTVYREPLQLGQLEEKRINGYFSTMTNITRDVTEQEEHALVMHIAQVSGLARYTRQEYVVKELYFLGSILNATVHGVSRYVTLSEMNFPIWLTISIAGVSGLSRWATLCIDEEEFPDEGFEEHQDNAKRSLKYDARQRGKDVIYETCFIILISIGSFIVPDKESSSVLSHRMVVIGCGGLAGVVSEMTLITAHRCHDQFMHQFNLVNFTIDTIVAPVSAVLLPSLLFSEENDFFADTEWVSKSSLAVMTTLVLRHLFKKFYPYAKSGLQQSGECLYSTFNYFRRNQNSASEQKEGACENKTDEVDTEHVTERTALLSDASQSRIPVRNEELGEAYYRPRQEKSCGERVIECVSSWYSFFSSGSPFSGRQQHGSEPSPVRRVERSHSLS